MFGNKTKKRHKTPTNLNDYPSLMEHYWNLTHWFAEALNFADKNPMQVQELGYYYSELMRLVDYLAQRNDVPAIGGLHPRQFAGEGQAALSCIPDPSENRCMTRDELNKFHYFAHPFIKPCNSYAARWSRQLKKW